MAYPKTVEADALALLKKAESMPWQSAGVARLRAMLELTAARTAIDADNAFEMPALIDEQAKAPGQTDASVAMLYALEARILLDIYTQKMWIYDKVAAPLEPYPAAVSKWSGEQFRTRIIALYKEALEHTDTTPLSVYSSCVEYSDDALQYVPTVEAFVRYQLYQAYDKIATYNSKYSYKTEQQALCKEAVAMTTQGSAPYFFWTWLTIDDPWKFDKQEALNLYDRYASVEPARYLLGQLCHEFSGFRSEEDEDDDEVSEDNALNDRMIAALRASLTAFPDWYDNNVLTNTLNMLALPEVVLTVPQYAAPGKDFEARYNYSFAKTITVKAYAMPAGVDRPTVLAVMKRMPSRFEKTVTVEGTRGKGSVSINLDTPGIYAVAVMVDDITESARYELVNVTPLYGFSVAAGSRAAAVAVDFTTGAPLKGVEVSASQQRKTYSSLGLTDDKGLLLTNTDATSHALRWKYKTYTYDFDGNIRLRRKADCDTAEHTVMTVMTDRGIYHPGDTVRFAAVAGITKPLTCASAVCGGSEVEVSWFDANNRLLDSIRAKTDAYGRVWGEFATKKNTLTGNYHMEVEVNGSREFAYVTVSDFKLDTFKAEISSISRDEPAPGCVTVRGNAISYSGMPVAGAKVMLVLRGANRWRWFTPASTLGRLEAETDAAGNFSIVLDKKLLDGDSDNGTAYKDFTCDVTVTDLTGQAVSTQRFFTIGKPYVLSVDVPNTADSDKPFSLDVQAYNADGKPVQIPYRWYIDCDAQTPAQPRGEGVTGKPETLNLKQLQSGYWRFVVEPVDTTLAAKSESSDIAFYSVKRNTMPDNAPALFVPETVASVEKGKVTIPLGANADELYLYAFMSDADALMTPKLYHLRRGMSKFTIDIPDDEITSFDLMTVLNGKPYTVRVSVVRPQAPSTAFSLETFRDRLVPGDTETWRLRLAAGTEGMADAGVIASMYNRALDALQQTSWPKRFNLWRSSNVYVSINSLRWYDRTITAYKLQMDLPTELFVLPVFKYVDPSIFYAESPMLKRASVLYGARAPMTGSEIMAAYNARVTADAAVVEEAEVEEEALEENKVVQAGDAGASNQNGGKQEVVYRPSEVLQAFWRPSLVTDADGNVDIVFTVPQANASWSFKAFGWTKALEAAGIDTRAMSSKPIMVQPSLPRFLRQGDKATLLCTVFNATDDEAEVVTTVELFDPMSGSVVKTVSQTDTIASQGSVIAAIEVAVPTDVAAIGYRARAVSGNYSDGEQTAMPVLSSAGTVVSSTEFYLNPGDSKPFELTVEPQEDATVTLQYCQNPIWTVVKAMRGVASINYKSSTAAASRLFSALAAKHIISNSPAVADALRTWRDNPSEEALTSMLERNAELKTLMLDQTPWLQAAKLQSERMAALARFLDPENAQAAVDAALNELTKYQNEDGGFAWTSWSSQSSDWCTRSVLSTLGIARSMGMLPESLNDMVSRAFDFVQAKAAEAPVADTDSKLTLIASLMPSLKRTIVTDAIIRRTVTSITRNWKRDNTVDKAYDILILLANGRRTEASAVLASIEQFGVVKPGMGLCFPNVTDMRGYATIIQAYAAMKAPAERIDAMRQWVIVQAQAMDDLGAFNPDYIIAAVLMTGSDWTSVQVKDLVTVDGKPLVLGKVESATGYFVEQLPTSGKAMTVTVLPNGVTPSYGSVVTVGRQVMTEVEARPGKDLAIGKRFLVERDGAWVETTAFALGERVRVQLTVEAGRDVEYVAITDERPAAFAPVEQLPGYVWDGSISFYRENNDATTNLFISYLPKGTYHIAYDMTASTSGSFTSGIATLQSQYAPELTARSGGCTVRVSEGEKR